ncbi:MAG: diguanylate cyclase [Candidatus Limnocylindrales bacterium]
MAGALPRRTAGAADRGIRRRRWFLFGSFFILGFVTLIRLLAGSPRLLDWVLAGFVVLTGLAATLYQGAVRTLEEGRRSEAETFARILQGLSRSISPDAIVDAIVEELWVGTGADHTVVVRLEADGRALEATMVSRRPGVPPSMTLLPVSLLDVGLPVPTPAGRPMVGLPVDAAEPVVAMARPTVAATSAGAGTSGAAAMSAASAPAASPAQAPSAPAPRPARRMAAPAIDLRSPERRTADAGRRSVRSDRRRSWSVLTAVASLRAISGAAPVPAVVRAGTASADPARLAATRIADGVRDAYGLTHTLAAPLVTGTGVIGAIVLSRRTADPWPSAAERILAGAAIEASAALDRAYSHRAAEARASTDALTGLPNRRYFDEFCGLLARRRRADDALGVLMIDIDHFKRLNDRHGHAVGDLVLRAVAEAIAGAVREDDVPARYGGEEFAVLLRNPSQQVAVEIGERVRASVASLDLREFGPSAVTVSVGVAISSAPDQPIDDLIAEADRALYRAKRGGRDRVVTA